jgi:hypothetical protein
LPPILFPFEDTSSFFLAEDMPENFNYRMIIFAVFGVIEALINGGKDFAKLGEMCDTQQSAPGAYNETIGITVIHYFNQK